jgi:hypothetical protein
MVLLLSPTSKTGMVEAVTKAVGHMGGQTKFSEEKKKKKVYEKFIALEQTQAWTYPHNNGYL